MKEERVVLVNENDEQVGLMNKLEAHEKGMLHRAFSVFIFNQNNELLLQKRAIGKYHSGGLWTNTCCSHPRNNESLLDAADRRLFEEMGFRTQLTKQFSFIYKSELENGLIEHELDHVIFGKYNESPAPNPLEAEDWKFMSLVELKNDIKVNSNEYTSWFKIVLNQVIEKQSVLLNESDSI